MYPVTLLSSCLTQNSRHEKNYLPGHVNTLKSVRGEFGRGRGLELNLISEGQCPHVDQPFTLTSGRSESCLCGLILWMEVQFRLRTQKVNCTSYLFLLTVCVSEGGRVHKRINLMKHQHSHSAQERIATTGRREYTSRFPHFPCNSVCFINISVLQRNTSSNVCQTEFSM